MPFNPDDPRWTSERIIYETAYAEGAASMKPEWESIYASGEANLQADWDFAIATAFGEGFPHKGPSAFADWAKALVAAGDELIMLTCAEGSPPPTILPAIQKWQGLVVHCGD